MKKTINIFITLLLVFCASSCDSYFDVDLNNQATLEDMFKQRNTTRQYLAHLYSFLPYEEKIDGREGGVVRRSDEALFGVSSYSAIFTNIRTGDYSSANINGVDNGNFWTRYYTAIRQCTIFMEMVDKKDETGNYLNQENTPAELEYMKAEARFLRAYYYYLLVRWYGPVIVWGEEQASEDIDAATMDRNTVKDNFDWILSQLDMAYEVLGKYKNVSEAGEHFDLGADMGRADNVAVLAVKSRVTLLAASPLYNGGAANPASSLYEASEAGVEPKYNNSANYYLDMTNYRGEQLFPQSYDEKKWQAAADAAKAVIDFAKANGKSLVTVTGKANAFENAAASYAGIYANGWTTETLWGWWYRTFSIGDGWLGTVGGLLAFTAPHGFAFEGYDLVTPSLKLVDTYPMMETGRYPIYGYAKDSDGNDYSQPYIDANSDYVNDGFTEGFEQPLLSHWTAAHTIKAHNSTIGRDPRYYVTLLPTGYYWPCEKMKADKPIVWTCHNSIDASSPWASSGAANRIGYAYKRLLPSENSLATQNHYTQVKYVYPAFRLAEAYINYAEALNELGKGSQACEALNVVRARVGLKPIEVAYNGIQNNKDLLRWVIRQEKMCEFAMEGHRHHDACRWMIAADEYPCNNWTLHVKAETYEDCYERVSDDYMGRPAVFKNRDFLMPLGSDDLASMTNFTQNKGF